MKNTQSEPAPKAVSAVPSGPAVWRPNPSSLLEIQYQALGDGRLDVKVKVAGNVVLHRQFSKRSEDVPFSAHEPGSRQQMLQGILRYELSERLATLKVADLNCPGGPIQEAKLWRSPARRNIRVNKPVPHSDPVRAPLNTAVPPYTFAGRLTLAFPSGAEFYGTGTLIQARNPRDSGLYVLTCAHNLFDSEEGGEVRTVKFQRGLNGQEHPPFPEVAAAQWFFLDEYRRYERDEQDFGLVKLAEQAAVENCPFMAPKTDEQLRTTPDITLVGLYGWQGTNNCMFSGAGQVGPITAAELGYNVSTSDGASGTAVLHGQDLNEIVAVHTTAGLEGDDHNYGVRITERVVQDVEGWQA